MDRSATIAIGCDHAGFVYKSAVKQYLVKRGFQVLDMGTDSPDSVDYPDFVHPVAQALSNGAAQIGIVMCGSANGVAMTANKHPHIRAAVCWNSTIAALSRQHNNANVLALPCRFISENEALEILKAFLDTPFEGGRHQKRIDKIPCC